MRKCSKCKEIKDFLSFSKDKQNISGYNCQCKDCRSKYRETQKEYFTKYRELNKSKLSEYFKEYRENNKEILKEKVKSKFTEEKKENRKQYLKKYRLENKKKLYENQKIYNTKNEVLVKDYQKKYRETNKENKKKYNLNYSKNRKKIDPLFKFKVGICDLINKSIKNKGYTKKSRTFTLLGCDFNYFKEYIESLFVEGMNWDNKGKGGWVIDHIYPNSLCKTEDELIKNQNYKNLQPLWGKDNLKKSNKII